MSGAKISLASQIAFIKVLREGGGRAGRSSLIAHEAANFDAISATLEWLRDREVMVRAIEAPAKACLQVVQAFDGYSAEDVTELFGSDGLAAIEACRALAPRKNAA